MKTTTSSQPDARHIPHLRARQLAIEWCEVRGPLADLAKTGAIVTALEGEMETLLKFCEETGQPLDLVGEVYFLLEYVREYGERGPVAGWQNLK